MIQANKKTSKQNKISYAKIYHWIFFVLFLILVFTAIMNTTFYSKESIIESFEFSMPMVGLIDVGYADQLFIARIERRAGWVFHFFTGVAAFCFIIARLYCLRKESMNYFNKLFYLVFITLFITGLPLYFRTDYEISKSIVDVSRSIHYVSAFVLFTWFIAHILRVVKKENSSSEASISKMLQFKAKAIISLILISSFNTELMSITIKESSNFEVGKAFAEGKKGAVKVKKVLPNCPYEDCKKAEEMKKKMGITEQDGRKFFTVEKKDYKKALYFLNESIKDNEKDSLKAAILANKILLKRINFKDKHPDDYLTKRLDVELGMTIAQYKENIKTYMLISHESNDCKLTYQYAAFRQKGYMDILEKGTKEENLKNYNRALNNCKKFSFERMMIKTEIGRM